MIFPTTIGEFDRRRKRAFVLVGWLWLFAISGGCTGGGDRSPMSAPSEVRNSIGMAMVRIPAGEFRMGCDKPTNDSVPNSPRHVVEISRPYLIGKFEVTQKEYEQIMGVTPSRFAPHGDDAEVVAGVDTSRFPVDHVTWEEAVEFCRRLSAMPAEKAAGRAYRLPTEAEWECACRVGTEETFGVANQLTTSQANISAPVDGGAPLARTASVGSYPANAWGLHDMHGNVWEWCLDGAREYSKVRVVDPRGPEAIAPVLRGGAWDCPADYARSDHRQEALRGYVFFGLRVVCEDRN